MNYLVDKQMKLVYFERIQHLLPYLALGEQKNKYTKLEQVINKLT